MAENPSGIHVDFFTLPDENRPDPQSRFTRHCN
jgi:hypothetical protein